MFTMLKKNTKYIPSIISSDKNNKMFFTYEPYIGCTHKPYFAVEVLFSYRTFENFELEKCYDNITVYTCCSSPKEAVDYAMEKWETVVRNKKTSAQNRDLSFVRISRVYVQIDDSYWKKDSKE